MHKRIKQVLSLLLAVAVLTVCVPAGMAANDQTSGTVPVTITASAPTFSVTVPTTLPIHMDAYGGITCGDITITNNSSGPVLVEDTQIASLNGWTLVDYATTTFTDANKGQHRVALQLSRRNGLTAAGADTGEDFIPAGGRQTISASAKIPYQGVDVVNTNIAQIVFVLGWHKADIPMTGLIITGGDSVDVGGTIQLAATKIPPDTTSEGVVQWTSSNRNIALVNSSGVVTGISAGTATITASCGGFTATKAIKVLTPYPNALPFTWTSEGTTNGLPTSPVLNRINETGYAGEFKLGTCDWDNSYLHHSVIRLGIPDGFYAESVVVETDSFSGLVNYSCNGGNEWSGVHDGYRGSSTYLNNSTIQVKVTLARGENPYGVPLTGLTITGSNTVDVGNTIQLSIAKIPSNTTDTETISWSSSNTTVATVSSTGVVTPHDIGTVVITASCNGVTATHTVTSTWTSTSDSYSIWLFGPTQATCTGGRNAVCRFTYGKNYDGIFAGFSSASGEHSIDFSNAGIPNSAVQSVSVNGIAFALTNGKWTYNGYLSGGDNTPVRFTLK